tara:strand:- start:142 stop:312 length:171 start_codon:yes stop_codon:yes gene_type:complete
MGRITTGTGDRVTTNLGACNLGTGRLTICTLGIIVVGNTLLGNKLVLQIGQFSPLL